MNCPACNHPLDEHYSNGCRHDIASVDWCNCRLTPDGVRLSALRAAWRAMPAGVREGLQQYHPETLAEWEGLLGL